MINILRIQLFFMCFLAIISGPLAANELVISGYQISTNPTAEQDEPGVLFSYATLPTDEVFLVPYWFSGDVGASHVTAKFNGEELRVIEGDPLRREELGILAIDIMEYQALSGTFELSLASSSTEAQDLLIINSIALADDDQAGEGDGERQQSGGGGSMGLVELVLVMLGMLLVAIRKRSLAA